MMKKYTNDELLAAISDFMDKEDRYDLEYDDYFGMLTDGEIDYYISFYNTGEFEGMTVRRAFDDTHTTIEFVEWMYEDMDTMLNEVFSQEVVNHLDRMIAENEGRVGV